MKRKSLPLFAVLFGIAVAGASPAGAAEFYEIDSPNTLGYSSCPGCDSVNFDIGGSPYATLAGQFTANYWDNSPAGAAPADSFLRMFCIEREYSTGDLKTYGRYGPGSGYYGVLTGADGATRIDNLRKLFDLYLPRDADEKVGDYYDSGRTDFGRYGTGTEEGDGIEDAAFQLAVWEIVLETDATFDLANGNVKNLGGTSSSILNQAKAYLTGVAGYDNSKTSYQQWAIYQFVNVGSGEIKGHQDFVTATYTWKEEANGVPEPGTLALLGLGLAGLAAARRRRQ